jgi:predicted metal-dependent hydrolase
MAREHLLGEIGHALLSRPELLAGVDARIARLFRWRGYQAAARHADVPTPIVRSPISTLGLRREARLLVARLTHDAPG